MKAFKQDGHIGIIMTQEQADQLFVLANETSWEIGEEKRHEELFVRDETTLDYQLYNCLKPVADNRDWSSSSKNSIVLKDRRPKKKAP